MGFRISAPKHAFTLLEVLVAAGLIVLSIGSIVTMNTRAVHLLRSSRQAAASSLVLQQRLEMLRSLPWSQISNAEALAASFATPMKSDLELLDAPFTESLTVSVPDGSPSSSTATQRSFTVLRTNGRVSVKGIGDFSAEPTLIFESSLQWREVSGARSRILRSVICRAGLTRAGIVGSVLGRPGTRQSSPGTFQK